MLRADGLYRRILVRYGRWWMGGSGPVARQAMNVREAPSPAVRISVLAARRSAGYPPDNCNRHGVSIRKFGRGPGI
jgi:hypothetical protein